MSEIQGETSVKEGITKDVPWQAVILNDDKTSFDIVELVLTTIFDKTEKEAADIAMRVHKNGADIAGGPYSEKDCKNRCGMAMDVARTFNMPLQVVAKKVD